MPESDPDGGSRPIRFRAQLRRQQPRVTIGTWLLIGVASSVLSTLGHLGTRRLVHAAERGWARAVARLLRLGLDVAGVENIDADRQYIVLSLHEGLADAVALLHLPIPLRFLVRDEMFDWPALGRYLRATGQIEVATEPTLSGMRTLYRDVKEAIASGESLLVFAQGSVLGIEVAFHKGAFQLARHFDLPILPVVITGSHQVWEHPYSPKVRLDQLVSVRVLPALERQSLDEQTARDLEREMKSLALGPTTAPARRFDPDRDGWWDGYDYEIDPDFADLASRLARRRADSDAGAGRNSSPSGQSGFKP